MFSEEEKTGILMALSQILVNQAHIMRLASSPGSSGSVSKWIENSDRIEDVLTDLIAARNRQ